MWAAIIAMASITLALVSAGAFSGSELPRGFTSQRQLFGINLLLILMPSYLIFAWGVSLRRAGRLLKEVDRLLGSAKYSPAATAPFTPLAAGAASGFLYGVFFNLPVDTIADLLAGGSLLICLVALMILVWVVVGLVLASRLHVAGLFRCAGKEVPVDPYDLSALEPFARSGMGDVAVVIGALVIATVQSIDATFRYQNYLFTTIVAIPAGLLLLLMPMTTLHKRLKEHKKREAAEVKALIRNAPKSLSPEHVSALESLLQRRDRIESLPTWPVNVSMVSRLLIYGVIPPAAWIGAALMERFVERLLE